MDRFTQGRSDGSIWRCAPHMGIVVTRPRNNVASRAMGSVPGGGLAISSSSLVMRAASLLSSKAWASRESRALVSSWTVARAGAYREVK